MSALKLKHQVYVLYLVVVKYSNPCYIPSFRMSDRPYFQIYPGEWMACQKRSQSV